MPDADKKFKVLMHLMVFLYQIFNIITNMHLVYSNSEFCHCGYNLRQNCMLYRGYTPKRPKKSIL
jgi:hypothetical protein